MVTREYCLGTRIVKQMYLEGTAGLLQLIPILSSSPFTKTPAHSLALVSKLLGLHVEA